MQNKADEQKELTPALARKQLTDVLDVNKIPAVGRWGWGGRVGGEIQGRNLCQQKKLVMGGGGGVEGGCPTAAAGIVFQLPPPPPLRKPGMYDAPLPVSGISGLSFDSTFLTPLLFFCLVIFALSVLSFFSANGPLS